MTDSSIFYLYEYIQDIIGNDVLKGVKNDLENDAIDKDDKIDSIEVDVQQEFGLSVNCENLAYETQYCFVLQISIFNSNMRFNWFLLESIENA